MINNNNQVKGLILTSIGVLAIVPDSILIRLIQADILTITFWRALIPGIIISIAVMIFYRKPTLNFLKSPKPSGLIFIVSHSFGTLLFVVAIELTSIASALFIISTSPIFAAIISRIFLNENITIRMIFTIIGALRNDSFDMTQIMTEGGPGRGSSDVMSRYMYQKTLFDQDYGYGSSIAIILFGITLVFIVIFLTRMVQQDERV